MVGTSVRRTFLLAVAGLALACLAAPVTACPFCSMQGQTLVGDVNQASMVLYGTFSNAKPGAGDEFGGGTTDLQIDSIIKKHEILVEKITTTDKREVLVDKKLITLPRYMPDQNKKVKWLVFCDVFKGKI